MRLFVALMLFCSTALAGDAASVSEKVTLLSAVAGNAAASLLTFNVPLGNGKIVTAARQMAVLHFAMDYTSGATAVTLTCSASDDNGTTLYPLQECPVVAGVATCVNVSWSKAIAAADTKWAIRIDATGYAYLRCVAAVTAGAANDSLTVTGWMSSK